MADFPGFPEFYLAANRKGGTEGDGEGQRPLPWQEDLANLVAAKGWGSIPAGEVGIPTGLGKTACIDIAVWALARSATLPAPRLVPTRTWWVVSRRLLVDAAHDRGERLARLLADPVLVFKRSASATEADRATLEAVAAALRSIASVSSDRPLHITRLRGGAELGKRVPDPSQPALIFATVPMFASRWLFRGFGTSESMRPVDAALAGIDALVLLDEAHLSVPLQSLTATQGPVELCDVGDPGTLLPHERARPRLIALTATGSGSGFTLGAADLAHDLVAKRLRARKPTSAATCEATHLVDVLATNVVALLDGLGRRGSAVVFCNAPTLARDVHRRLKKTLRMRGIPAELLLLTGQMREREAGVVRARLLGREGASAGRPRGRETDLVVVATQTLEVGADLDFDLLVTEGADARAITQRLGRLNRLGDIDDARGVVIHAADSKPSALYPEAAAVWKAISAAANGGTMDLCPAAVAEVMSAAAEGPRRRVGELLPGHLWEWAKTSRAPAGEAPPALFFEGFADRGLASVVWRAHIPAAGVRLVPRIREDEAVEIRVTDLKEALKSRKIADVHRLGPDRRTVENVTDLAELAEGDVVLLSPSDGYYDALGWDAKSRGDVLDLSPTSGVLVLSEELITNLVPDANAELLAQVRALQTDDLDPASEAKAAGDLLTLLRESTPHSWLHSPDAETPEWERWLERISTIVKRPEDDLPYLARKPRRQAELPQTIDLLEHLSAVATTARGMAEHIGLPAELTRAVRRAASLHDIGKAERRFQQWLDPLRLLAAPGLTQEALGADLNLLPTELVPGSITALPPGKSPPPGQPEALTSHLGRRSLLAKSATPQSQWESTRRATGWPKGGRHELLSARLAQCLGESDLVLHLILSHHGEGRPFVPIVKDGSPERFPFLEAENGRVLDVPGDLSLPDWDQPARFRVLCEHYGYWGLALLEAIVRQADQLASGYWEVI
jgi:CRISPR-associated endonuclease/helicase Cas3